MGVEWQEFKRQIIGRQRDIRESREVLRKLDIIAERHTDTNSRRKLKGRPMVRMAWRYRGGVR